MTLRKMLDLIEAVGKEITWTFSADKFNNDLNTANFWCLLYPIPLSLLLLSVRYLLSRFAFIPFARYLNVKNNPKSLIPHPKLEKIYLKNHKLLQSQMCQLMKETDLSKSELEKWFHLRKRQDRPGIVPKFCEECWKFTYYSSAFFYGLVVLWTKDWLWDITRCWDNYPLQQITSDLWWYYMISLSFYWSLFIGQFQIDTKRKDYWQMFIHHNSTILLISFSWLSGALRIGSLVLLVHDAADLLLAGAKIARYVRFNGTCYAFLLAFLITWIITRLGIFPFWILRHTIFETRRYTPVGFPYYITNSLLSILLLLHCYWTFLIGQYCSSLAGKKAPRGDNRSSSEDSD